MRRAQPWKTNRARVLRADATSAEDKLWQELRGRRLEGLKFVRQFPIGPYFADFACRAKKVVVEVDGATHGTDAEIAADAVRATFFDSQGYRLIRFANQDVYENLDGVIFALLAFIRDEQI